MGFIDSPNTGFESQTLSDDPLAPLFAPLTSLAVCVNPGSAFNCGSVPEVMDHGVTGFVVNDIDGAVAALKNIHTLDRARVRATFDRRFTARRMAEDYVDLYEELAQPARHLHAVTA